MDLTELIGASIIALGSGAVILLTVFSFSLLSRSVESRRFADSMMLEAAEQFRNELARLGQDQSLYLIAIMGFLVTFALYCLLPANGLFDSVAKWRLLVAVVLLTAAASFVVYRLCCLAGARRKVRLLRDANIAVGHALLKLAENRNRVFHDVRCGNARIDHVVAGLHGIYAVSVIARKSGQDSAVSMNADTITFTSGESVTLESYGQASAWLATDIRKRLGHPVRVRSVIALPGWQLNVQASERFLVVNERNIAMLTGWKDQSDHLLNEDVEAIHDMLTERCSRYGRTRKARNLPKA